MRLARIAVALGFLATGLAAQASEVPDGLAVPSEFEDWRARLPAPPIGFQLRYSLGPASLGVEPEPLDRDPAELVAEARAAIQGGDGSLENWSQLAVGYVRTRDAGLEEAWAKLGPLLQERMQADPADLAAMLTASSMLEEYAMYGGMPEVVGMANEHLERARAIAPDSPEVARRLARVNVYARPAWHDDPRGNERGMAWARAALLADPSDLEPLITLSAGFMNRLHLALDEVSGGHDGPEPARAVTPDEVAVLALELAQEVPAYAEGTADPAVVKGVLYARLLAWSQFEAWAYRVGRDGGASPAPESQRERLMSMEVDLVLLRDKLDHYPAVRAGVEAALWALRTNVRGELADSRALDAVLSDLEFPEPWIELRFFRAVDRGDFAAAETTLTEFADSFQPGRVALLRGELEFERDEPRAAREWFERAADVEAQADEARVGMAFCDLALGADDEVTRAVLIESVERTPAQPLTWFALAVAQALAGELESARTSVQRALDSDPDNATYLRLAMALEPGAE